jgi:hypothetical protein
MPAYFYRIQLFAFSVLISLNVFSQNKAIENDKSELIADNQIYISEFMASNSATIKDEDNDYSDWIELHNPTANTLDLTNWYLTDDLKNLNKWKFPSAQIPAGGYIIVWASGKDKRITGQNLHSSFKLSADGENVALVKPDGSSIQFSFGLGYPAQFADISYGMVNDAFVYLSEATPGSANSGAEFLPPPNYNVTRGIFNTPFYVTLTTIFPDGQIFYTVDGSVPSIDNGIVYSEPIHISTTTPLRSVVIRGASSSTIETNTYFFLEDVIKQPNNPVGYPNHWGKYYSISGTSIADYEMDPEVTQVTGIQDSLMKAFKSIPLLSLVTDKDNFFLDSLSEDVGGIYIFTGADGISPGDGWERPVSVEYLSNNPMQENFATHCGIQIQGGAGRMPEKSPKHSLRLTFRSEYGPAKLKYTLFDDPSSTDKFNGFVLRAGFNNSWFHWDASQRDRTQYLRDAWYKDSYLATKNTTAHSKFIHLFINGMYWGVYHMSERVDNDLLESYLGGNEEDYDVIKDFSEVLSGVKTDWDNMFVMARKDMSQNANYFKVLGQNEDGSENASYPNYLDADNLIDYMLVNFYGGNIDWDHHNWIAGRNRVNPGKGFQFFCWDGEQILLDLNHNVVGENNTDCPSELYARLKMNEEFRLKFADRVQKHFYAEGALTPEKVVERYNKRAQEIWPALIAESARWGDYRRDVHPYQSGPYNLYSPYEQWNDEYNRLVNEYFPYRTDVVLEQLRLINLVSSVDAPVFSRYGGIVGNGFELTISAPMGDIYYTSDNTDPRRIGGTISANAALYGNSPVVINGKQTIKARAYSNNIWSAVTEATFNDFSATPVNDPLFNNPASITSRVYPNPFNTEAGIFYFLPENGKVQVAIYSIDGSLIETLVDGYQTAGKQIVRWNASAYSYGMYFYKIKIGNYSTSGKMVYNR